MKTNKLNCNNTLLHRGYLEGSLREKMIISSLKNVSEHQEKHIMSLNLFKQYGTYAYTVIAPYNLGFYCSYEVIMLGSTVSAQPNEG
jgi:hypothetical protein